MATVRRQRRNFLNGAALLAAAAPLAGFIWIETWLAPAAKPWRRWQRHNNANRAGIGHAPWTDFLAKYLKPGADGINRLAYGAVSPGDRRALSKYLDHLTAQPISGFAQAEQLAYWINLYNARTVLLILEHFPVTSILDIKISPGWLSFGPWDKKLIRVEGQALSLNDIEHRILRPGWRDNRVHYALNCAALGCPNLSPQAYTRANAETQLAAGAVAYINHPRGVSVLGNNATVSKIYAWFKADFGGRDAGVIRHLQKHAGPELQALLGPGTRISNYVYDWSLNGTARSGG